MSSRPQLNIFYRHVHIKADKLSRDPNKNRPNWFSHEICFSNLLKTIKDDPLGNNVKLTIVYDGTLNDFREDFIFKYVTPESEINLQLIDAKSDLNSFLITLHVASQVTKYDQDLIYILENDYLHKPGWISKIYELYEHQERFDYVSLYDHNDKYIYQAYDNLSSKIITTPSQHWRTTPSTCASFILTKNKLIKDIDVFASGLTDYYFFNKLIIERSRILLTPVPGLATHSMEGYLSPVINWLEIAKNSMM